MALIIAGKAFVLGNDIDTDQIIPAKHLVYSMENPEERKKYGQYALSSVPISKSGLPDGNIPFIENGKYESEYQIIIGGKNFGCGSSREHAPFALKMAGVKAVIATSYARIFYRNSIDGGFVTPFESQIDLSKKIITGNFLKINQKENSVVNKTTKEEYVLKPLGEVAGIVQAGGIFEYARVNGMM